MNKERILLMGYGDMARRLTEKLNAYGHHLTAIKRKPIDNAMVAVTAMDCTDAESMNAFFISHQFDVIVITMSPDEYTDTGYDKAYVQPVNCLIKALKGSNNWPRQVFFVSSTSVYHQSDGQIVDEQSSTQPTRFNGKRILEAEELLTNSDVPTTVIRFSGIYGRSVDGLLKQVSEGHSALPQPIIYTNRIHIDDCIGILMHLIKLSQQQKLAPVYIGTDDLSAPLYNVQQWLNLRLQKKGMVIVQQPQQNTRQKTRRGSKQCANKAIVNSGYRFEYPDYKSGYSSLLQKIQLKTNGQLYLPEDQ